MGGFSIWHILIFAVILLLLFGGNRFSNMMGDVAKGLKSFKKGMSEDEEVEQRRLSAERSLDSTPPPAPAAPAAPAEAAPAERGSASEADRL